MAEMTLNKKMRAFDDEVALTVAPKALRLFETVKQNRRRSVRSVCATKKRNLAADATLSSVST
jgi:hypothetical protein